MFRVLHHVFQITIQFRRRLRENTYFASTKKLLHNLLSCYLHSVLRTISDMLMGLVNWNFYYKLIKSTKCQTQLLTILDSLQKNDDISQTCAAKLQKRRQNPNIHVLPIVTAADPWFWFREQKVRLFTKVARKRSVTPSRLPPSPANTKAWSHLHRRSQCTKQI